MNRKQEFESLLAKIADAPVSFAGRDSPRNDASGKVPSRIKANLSDGEGMSPEVVLQEIRRAKARQRRNPSLFSGDPEGFFTYDDPVLATMAYLYQSHIRMSSVLGIAGKNGENLRNDSYWKWAETAIRIWLSRNEKSYQTLMGMTPQELIEVDTEVMRIAVTGDAGFRGQAQANVIYDMRERHNTAPFDLLIHLGDIYFSGNSGEILDNFIAPFRSVCPKVFTLPGNHDLYFGGDAFLSALEALKQPGRYFCVENTHWRIACLDTALPAETLRRNSGLLDKGQLAWLDKLLEIDDGKRTILMSHHFIISGWDKPSEGLRRQLATRLKKIFAWYWGHEHGCATYDKKAAGFYGACVGNGAFLEVRRVRSRKPTPQWYAKGCCTCYANRSNFWPHGYLELELQPTRIVETYHLEGGKSHTRILDSASPVKSV